MPTVKLIGVHDKASGELGLIVESLRQLDDTFMAANEGLLIAHDILEHQNGIKAIGSIDDELKALGGVWYVRGQFGYIRKNTIDSLKRVLPLRYVI